MGEVFPAAITDFKTAYQLHIWGIRIYKAYAALFVVKIEHAVGIYTHALVKVKGIQQLATFSIQTYPFLLSGIGSKYFIATTDKATEIIDDVLVSPYFRNLTAILRKLRYWREYRKWYPEPVTIAGGHLWHQSRGIRKSRR